MSTKTRITATKAEALQALLSPVGEAHDAVEELLDELVDEMDSEDRDNVTQELDEALASLDAAVKALVAKRGGS